MRMIGTLSFEANARRFSAFLAHRGIENRCEISGASYQIWVADEDRLDEAHALFKQFEANPAASTFDAPIRFQIAAPSAVEEPPEEAPTRRASAPITSFFLAVCVFLFFLNAMQEVAEEKGTPFTPVEESLLFDTPKPPPSFQGFYDIVLLKRKTGDATPAEGPLFTEIRAGQFWRLFSPCLLHRDLLHILFNMIWLWVLGRPIEQRIGSLRTLLLTLVAGVAPNVAQYLMSGPLFLGYSGVICAFGGFIWMRQRVAPWEGYPVQRATLYFLAVFVVAMCALQTASFLVQYFSSLPFVLTIANTAHLVGALVGLLLGRLSAFAWRVET